MHSQDTSEDSRVLLIVDDEENLRHVLRVILEQSNFRVLEATDGVDAIQVLDDHPEVGLVLCDVRMPRMDGMAFLDAVAGRGLNVVLMSAYGTTGTAVEAISRGAVDYISKPFRPDEIRVCLDRLKGRQALEAENQRLRAAVDAPVSLGGFVGRSAGAKSVISLVEKVAAYPTTVLLTGESGTGKEVLARALHSRSDRARQPFIAVNCGAIPESLLESELFGHERGAFTGAVRAHPGLFEQAHGGTLLLDEIGEMPLALQTRLLRVLEEGRVRRVGGQKDRACDVRVVAATARNLEQMVEEKLFRDDLFYRLRVVHITVPPLRDRLEDVPLLVDALLLRVGERLGVDGLQVSDSCMRVLISYSWPGNVRQLENALERALLMAEGSVIDVGDLPEELRPATTALPAEPQGDDLSIKRHTASLERLLISRALARTGGNRSQAAQLLDISYKALVYKIRGYGLDSE
ncbi:MAG: hypothetical protein CL930_12250 [Deltaproteobacteria bacterium]|nr:hypothetical protein [Deltaproteobacteria bacterium]